MSDARCARRDRWSGTRNRARALVVAPLLAAAIGGGVAASQPASAATTWAGLRQCESGGNYRANTGNGYFGAYQFTLSTWRGLGYSGLPSDAAPAVQDQAALRLARRSGFSQWPACGRGMGADDLASSSISPVQASRSTARVIVPAVYTSSAGRPYFTTAMASTVRDDVRSWQARMNTLGYHITVDGCYGPQSAQATRSLQAAKGFPVDGIVGPRTWAATFGVV